jgi:mitochondrial fission protein ELM1
MNPTLPRRLFDLCVLPIHDGVAEGGNVMLSLGALNRILPSDRRDARAALILVGGPSKHHGWSQTGILEQVRAITASAPQRSWVVAGSPRTPTETVHALRGFARVQTLAFEETDADWLPGRLADAGTVWVTEDSVSMAYEAASSGAAVGLLDVPTRHQGRVHAAVKALREAGYATTMSDWRGGMELRAPDPPLQEAARCAEALLARWPELA